MRFGDQFFRFLPWGAAAAVVACGVVFLSARHPVEAIVRSEASTKLAIAAPKDQRNPQPGLSIVADAAPSVAPETVPAKLAPNTLETARSGEPPRASDGEPPRISDSASPAIGQRAPAAAEPRAKDATGSLPKESLASLPKSGPKFEKSAHKTRHTKVRHRATKHQIAKTSHRRRTHWRH
jgi:hypothetical protein